MDYLELLPPRITHEGEDYWLRIKAREKSESNENIKKWVIRYIGKRHDAKKEKYSYTAKVRGFTYKTLCQFWGNNLQLLAKRTYENIKNYAK